MRSTLKVLPGIIALCVIVVGVLAYWVETGDPITGIRYDGLGRTLTEIPNWAKHFVPGYHWAGLLWWILDIIFFFGAIIMALNINKKYKAMNS